MKLNTTSAQLDVLNDAIERTRTSSKTVTVDKAALFALITDHRDLCKALGLRGLFVDD